MRRCTPSFFLGVAPAFRPHLHQCPCAVCNAAQRQAATRAAQAETKAPRAVCPAVATASAASALSAAGSASLIEQRRAALEQWMRTFAPVAPSNASTSAIRSSEDFDVVYSTYVHTKDSALEKTLYKQLLGTLDEQCARIDVPAAMIGGSQDIAAATTNAANDEALVRVPRRVTVPRVAEQSVSIVAPSTNVFEQHVHAVFPNDPAAVAKQLEFQTALLSIKEVFDQEKIPFFLACGTALGARRNGCFIPYDEDIDLGILYSDLAQGTSDAAPSVIAAPPGNSTMPNLRNVQDRLFRMINALASTGQFLVFDVCGAVEKGFELRVLYAPTSTRIDINLYYPPVHGSDDALVRAEGPFLWASSFYEQAHERAHQMYRYRHCPFDQELTRVLFCAKDATADSFLVPPVRYLEENYGADWKTPKQYTYTDGLAGEFKNILKE